MPLSSAGSGGGYSRPTSRQLLTWAERATPNLFAAPRADVLDSACDADLLREQLRLSLGLLVVWFCFTLVTLAVYASTTNALIVTVLRPTVAQFNAALDLAPNCPCGAPATPSSWVTFAWSPMFNTSTNVCSVARGYGEAPTYTVSTQSLLLTTQLCDSLDRMSTAAMTAVASFRGAGVGSLASRASLVAAIELATIEAYATAYHADLNKLGEAPNLLTVDPAATARRTRSNTRLFGATRVNSIAFGNDPAGTDAPCSCLDVSPSGVGPVPSCSYVPSFVWDEFFGPALYLNNTGVRTGWWECAYEFFMNYYSRFPLHALADPRYLGDIVVGAINDPNGTLRNRSAPINNTQFFRVDPTAAVAARFGPRFAAFVPTTLASAVSGATTAATVGPLDGMLTPRHLYESAKIHVREADYWASVVERSGFGFSTPLPAGPLSWVDGVVTVHYDDYFRQCAAPSCSYITAAPPSYLNVITTGISLAGGSFTALQIAFAMLWGAVVSRRARRMGCSGGGSCSSDSESGGAAAGASAKKWRVITAVPSLKRAAAARAAIPASSKIVFNPLGAATGDAAVGATGVSDESVTQSTAAPADRGLRVQLAADLGGGRVAMAGDDIDGFR